MGQQRFPCFGTETANLALQFLIGNLTEELRQRQEDTKKVSFRLFKEGMKVKEIAEFRELTTGTISNHLLHYVQTGDIKLQELVDPKKINYITAHLQKLPSLPQGVKEIKEKLGEYASYDEIRFVFEVYKKHIPA